MRADGDKFTAKRLRVEADLSDTGDAVFGIVAGGDLGYHLMDWIDADSDGDQEPVVYLASDDEQPETVDLRVLDLIDGQLVEIERRGDPPIQRGLVLDRQVDPETSLKFDASWWIADGTLYSARTVDSYPAYGMSYELPEVYPIEVWAWRADDGVLVPQEEQRQCLRLGREKPISCAEADSVGVPAFFPEATDRIGMGDSFDLFTGGTVSLAGTVDSGGTRDAELVVTFGSQSQRLRGSRPGRCRRCRWCRSTPTPTSRCSSPGKAPTARRTC